MLLASMDVGSNSIRLLVGEVSGGRVSPVHYERVATRLARNLKIRNALDEEAMKETLSAIAGFLISIRKYGVLNCRAVGTSALREASNSTEFIRMLRKKTGIDVDVISGHKEAELTAQGVLSSLTENVNSLIIDIGGGSTEAILCISNEAIARKTYPVGVVKMLDRYILSDPPSDGQVMAIDSEAEELAMDISNSFHETLSDDFRMIGTAGTATTIACMDLGLKIYDHAKVHMHKIPFNRLVMMSKKLATLTLEERKNIDGLDPDRADLIIPGIRLTIKLMEQLGFKDLHVSDYGLLEGVLLKLSEEVPS